MTASHAPSPADMAVPISLGQVKRCLEWCSASDDFRALIQSDPARAGIDYKLGFDPQIIRILWDPFYAIEAVRGGHPTHPCVRAYQEFFATKVKWRDSAKEECAPDEPRFRAWRARQIARNAHENGAYDDYIIHTPFAIEITDGCSVGCWFCGVGATKHMQSFAYTPENAVLWRDTVTMLRDVIGAASKWGFLYWATDPIDNPDYELFASDFADIVGLFPQTTTAQGHKDPARMRRILETSKARGCEVNRFSVVSERLLRQIHESYTADELLGVEIVPQMPGGTTPKAASGAFMDRAKKNKKVIETERAKLAVIADQRVRLQDEAAEVGPPMSMEQPGTIACVSGFLLNMVTRTVKLISPCRASEAWPLGYIVFEERVFADAADLAEIVEAMIDAHMAPAVDTEKRISLAPGLQYMRVSDGFRLTSPMTLLSFERPDMSAYVGSIGDRMRSGERTAGEIALSAFFEHGVPEANTLDTISALFDQGLVLASSRPPALAVAAE